MRMSTLLGTPTMVIVRNKASIQDGIRPISLSATASRAVMGKISIRMSPFLEILSEIS
jgi:hypothetical protein